MKRDRRLAVVTGGNRGIGLEICRQLGKKGLRVIMTARSPAKGRRAAASLRREGIEVEFHPLDVTSDASVRRLRRFLERLGRLDVLVNNAGVYFEGGYWDDGDSISVFDEPLAMVERTMDVNLYGPYRLCQALIPLMLKSGYGRVVNVSSVSGQLSTMPGRETGYRLSKTALNALTRVWAAELKGSGVLVNAMCPGWVRTDMGGPHAKRTPARAAATAVWLAALPNKGPSGFFFRDRRRLPW